MESWRLMHRQFLSGMIEKFWRRDNGGGCTTAGPQLKKLMGLGLGAVSYLEEHDLRRAGRASPQGGEELKPSK